MINIRDALAKQFAVFAWYLSGITFEEFLSWPDAMREAMRDQLEVLTQAPKPQDIDKGKA